MTYNLRLFLFQFYATNICYPHQVLGALGRRSKWETQSSSPRKDSLAFSHLEVNLSLRSHSEKYIQKSPRSNLYLYWNLFKIVQRESTHNAEQNWLKPAFSATFYLHKYLIRTCVYIRVHCTCPPRLFSLFKLPKNLSDSTPKDFSHLPSQSLYLTLFSCWWCSNNCHINLTGIFQLLQVSSSPTSSKWLTRSSPGNTQASGWSQRKCRLLLLSKLRKGNAMNILMIIFLHQEGIIY